MMTAEQIDEMVREAELPNGVSVTLRGEMVCASWHDAESSAVLEVSCSRHPALLAAVLAGVRQVRDPFTPDGARDRRDA